MNPLNKFYYSIISSDNFVPLISNKYEICLNPFTSPIGKQYFEMYNEGLNYTIPPYCSVAIEMLNKDDVKLSLVNKDRLNWFVYRGKDSAYTVDWQALSFSLLNSYFGIGLDYDNGIVSVYMNSTQVASINNSQYMDMSTMTNFCIGIGAKLSLNIGNKEFHNSIPTGYKPVIDIIRDYNIKINGIEIFGFK